MLCPNCHKQIIDTSTQCPFCSHLIDHKDQVLREASLRRYQRWFFYALISILFVGMIFTIVKIYNINSELLSKMVMAQQSLEQKDLDLEAVQEVIEGKDKELSSVKEDLSEAEKEIIEKTEKYKEVLFEKGGLEEKYDRVTTEKEDLAYEKEKCENRLSQTDASVYAMIIELAVGISNDNLAKIPVAEANFSGLDSDGDGLSDMIEEAIGTDIKMKDTDQDGFEDKAELLGGFNPLGKGNQEIDKYLISEQKGNILLQVEGQGEAWYLDPETEKRFFLGSPADALEVLANI